MGISEGCVNFLLFEAMFLLPGCDDGVRRMVCCNVALLRVVW